MITDEKRLDKVILLNVNANNNYQELLGELAEYAIEKGLADKEFKEALIDREIKYPTGIQSSVGVAIAHTEQNHALKSTILIGKLKNPVEFKPMVGRELVKVEVVFVLIVKDAKNQVKVLENIANIIQDKHKIMAIKNNNEASLMLDDMFKDCL